MTTKFLITFSAFTILTLTSIGTKAERVKTPESINTVNNELLKKELQLRVLENESNCLDNEIRVAAIKIDAE